MEDKIEIGEIWKDIKGYEGLYQVSNLGNVKSGNNYSTDEQVVGTWINGKPIYRKVVIIDNPSNGETISIANIDEPINAIWKQTYGSSPLCFNYNENGSSRSAITFNTTSKNFEITMTGGFKGKMVVIVEYTKTTNA